jgi:site-specific recombinase XerD
LENTTSVTVIPQTALKLSKHGHTITKRRSRAERIAAINRVEYLTEQEYVDLICATKTHEHRILLQLLWESGLRIHEALGLVRDNLYPDGLNIVGKGNKPRYVPCQPALISELKLLANRIDNTRVFRSIKTRTGALMMMRRYAVATNLPKRIHPHLFRHSFAINFIQQTGNPFALQDIGGWSDMETIKIYMRLAKEAPKEALQKMRFPNVGFKKV